MANSRIPSTLYWVGKIRRGVLHHVEGRSKRSRKSYGVLLIFSTDREGVYQHNRQHLIPLPEENKKTENSCCSDAGIISAETTSSLGQSGGHSSNCSESGNANILHGQTEDPCSTDSPQRPLLKSSVCHPPRRSE